MNLLSATRDYHSTLVADSTFTSTESMSSSLSGIELKRRWRLGNKIGSGGCAEVYQVTDLRGADGEELVAKVAPLPEGLPPAMSKGKKRKKTDKEKHADMLYYEYTLYNGYLRAHKGVPKVMLWLFHMFRRDSVPPALDHSLQANCWGRTSLKKHVAQLFDRPSPVNCYKVVHY